jgi:hypothetical protein
MASFPPRRENLALSVPSIARQVDRVHLVLNEYHESADSLAMPVNVEIVLPRDDLKDTGKFAVPVHPDDFVFLCDDDILYPVDYCVVMKDKLAAYAKLKAIVGVHGVTYPDFYDGTPAARLVNAFTQALPDDAFVNQLGTGTVACRGYQMPEFEAVRTAARFVDVRFAVHCERLGYPRVCVAREKGWMSELKGGPSLFETFTKEWPIEVVREAQCIAGTRFLHIDAPLRVAGPAGTASPRSAQPVAA